MKKPIKQPTYGFAAVDKMSGAINFQSAYPTREQAEKWMDIHYAMWKRSYQVRQIIAVVK